MNSTRSKRSTASAIATTKSDGARIEPIWREPPASAHRGLWSSRLVRLIFAWNFVGFAILTLGVLLLSELREQLIQAKIDALATQGELVANVLAETATIGDPRPLLLERRAAQVLQRLVLPHATRARLFLPDGTLVADSNVLADRIIEHPLPPAAPPASAKGDFEKTAGAVGDAIRNLTVWRISPWRPDFTLAQERARAARGDRTAGQRLGDSGERVVSVSIPVQRVQAVLGVLTVESADVDDILNAERRSMLPFILVAGAISLLFSLLLSLVIAQPLRRLAFAADQVRETGATRLFLPEATSRQDEIGDLAQALERMTGALADRIDTNERFAADVSHEIKNPLTSIRSAVETARNVTDPAAREKLLAIIAADVVRLDRLITDISRASRLEAETARGVENRVDLGKLLFEISDTYSATGREGEARVEFKGPPPPGAFVNGQEGPLGQVFRNLIDNARSFTPEGDIVTVSLTLIVRRDGRWLRAMVEDEGPGIPKDNLETIFQRFYTERPKGAAFGRNSGLGLSIARQIVEAHRGKIWAENIADPGTGDTIGARLVVELPAAKETQR
jgi:two-component system sensor histidine kinase ChvG